LHHYRIRAYDLVQIHHALGTCAILYPADFTRKEFGLHLKNTVILQLQRFVRVTSPALLIYHLARL